MTAIHDSSPAVAPSVIAGLLLAAREHQQRLDLPSPSIEQIVTRTGAARSCAYEAKTKVLGALSGLVRPVGRPPAPATAPAACTEAVCHEVLRFVMSHPGCIHGGPRRRLYADCFRRFVLEIQGRHPELSVEQLAQATEVPLDTVRAWLRAPAVSDAGSDRGSESAAPAGGNLYIQTILAAWEGWSGGFVDFCDHVHDHLRIPMGRTAVAAILEAHGIRLRRRRGGRSPDELALRESFETFFPGAQWVADGTPVAVSFLGERFTFNLELNVDAYSGAFTGASVHDEEDSAALIEAVEDGKVTTGAAPLAVLVDNRPSNLTPEVAESLGQTRVIPATKARPQNKAHVEGGFGLFFQMLPPLVLAAATKREAARQMLILMVETWARTLNHRPRRDRGGKSRVELYGNKPTTDQIIKARAALEERLKRQQAARRTLQARQDPLVRQTLTAAFARLGIIDPQGHLLDAIARYPLAPVLDAIATFEGKAAAGSLPRDLDQPGRYLLGIVRNIAQEREGNLISAAMLRARLQARDAQLAGLVEHQRTIEQHAANVPPMIVCFIDNAMETNRLIDRLFWLSAAGDLVRLAPAADAASLFRLAARRINTASRVSYSDRLKATRWLANKAIPVD